MAFTEVRSLETGVRRSEKAEAMYRKLWSSRHGQELRPAAASSHHDLSYCRHPSRQRALTIRSLPSYSLRLRVFARNILSFGCVALALLVLVDNNGLN